MTIHSKIMVGNSPRWAIQMRGFYVSNIPGNNLAHGNDALTGGSTSCESFSINSLQ